jgi:Lectin C-type domain
MRRTAPVAAIGAATLACLWAGARMNHNFSDMAAHAAADGGSFGRLNAAASPMFGAGRDRGEMSGDPAMNLKNSARVAAMAVTAAVTANGALAGDAVQWRVEDGGNGHWYSRFVSPIVVTWPQARNQAATVGGHLATISSSNENEFVFQASRPSLWSNRFGPWIGAFRLPDSGELGGAWAWVTSEPWTYTAWEIYQPDNGCLGDESSIQFINYTNSWNDLSPSGACGSEKCFHFMVEWEADCNSDAIVDYGQCHDGTLPDYNGNNIPDCCEQGVQCTVGNYPVQWNVSDGGNGHWYQFIETTTPRTWQSARDWAPSIGSHLATLTSAVEQSFIISIAPDFQDESGGQAWLGGYQDRNAPDFIEPYGGWRWITGEPVTYVGWVNSGDTPLAGADFLTLGKDFQGAFGWNAIPTDYAGGRKFCFVEFDTDCNNDNIVDYGQILNGTLPDTNANNIPDCCEPGNSCCLGDIYENHIVDGGDLGVLLSEWGVVTPTTRSDINRDGFVDGADLGRLLANWGPCGG